MVSLQQQQLYAYLHITEEGRYHLRVKQPLFAVEQRYTDDFADRMRHVGTPARWLEDKQEWDYPLTAASVNVLKEIEKDFNLDILWSEDLQQFAQDQYKLVEYEEQVRLSIEKALKDGAEFPSYPTNTFNGEKPPLRHQQAAYHWSLRVEGLLLAHDPGLGKTREGVDAAGGWYRHGIIRPMSNYSADGTALWEPPHWVYTGKIVDGQYEIKQKRKGHWKVEGGLLIVCPKAVIRTWSRELHTWQQMTSVEITGGRSRKLKRSGTVAHAHIVNYESLDIVSLNKYDAIIVDESHRCANQSNQTAAVLELALQCKRKLLLSGSPVSNSLESVFNQMLIVDGGRSLGVNRQAFLNEYFHSERNGPGVKNVPRTGAVEAVAKKMARACYFLKKEDAYDLPEKFHTPIYVEMEADQKRYYEALKEEAITYIKDATVTVEQAQSKAMKLMQVAQGIIKDDEGQWLRFNSIKQDVLIEDLKNELLGRKVIVWCRFTEEIDMLVERLSKEGIWCLRFDGNVKHNQRNAVIEAFNTDPRYTVFVGQVSMGEGIELVAENCTVPCFNMYYLGLDYRYINWVQSQDRMHRLTQRYNCNYKYLLTENGIDRTIYKAVMAKANMANTVTKVGKDYYLSLITDDTPSLGALEAA